MTIDYTKLRCGCKVVAARAFIRFNVDTALSALREMPGGSGEIAHSTVDIT